MMEQKVSWMQDERMRQYFDGLPTFVQENIMQSSVPFNSYEELVSCADNIREGRGWKNKGPDQQS